MRWKTKPRRDRGFVLDVFDRFLGTGVDVGWHALERAGDLLAIHEARDVANGPFVGLTVLACGLFPEVPDEARIGARRG